MYSNMQKFKKNKRAIGRKHSVLWATQDPDVVVETWTKKKRINLGDLRKRKSDIQQQLANPDDIATLVEGQIEIENEMLQAELSEVENELAKYNG